MYLLRTLKETDFYTKLNSYSEIVDFVTQIHFHHFRTVCFMLVDNLFATVEHILEFSKSIGNAILFNTNTLFYFITDKIIKV